MELYNPEINIMNDSHNQPNTPAYKKRELLFKKYQNLNFKVRSEKGQIHCHSERFALFKYDLIFFIILN